MTGGSRYVRPLHPETTANWWCGEWQAARGIEAGTAETQSGSVHESPTVSPPGDAPKLDRFP